MNRLLANIDIDEVTGCWNWLGRRKRGHEFTPENTLLKSREGSRVERICRTCLHKAQAQTRLNQTPEQRAARKEYMRKWNAS